MTINELIAEAEKLAGWRLQGNGPYIEIRRGTGRGCQCPITAVAESKIGKFFKLDDVKSVARSIGISYGPAGSIMHAADDVINTKWQRGIREHMIQQLIR